MAARKGYSVPASHREALDALHVLHFGRVPCTRAFRRSAHRERIEALAARTEAGAVTTFYAIDKDRWTISADERYLTEWPDESFPSMPYRDVVAYLLTEHGYQVGAAKVAPTASVGRKATRAELIAAARDLFELVTLKGIPAPQSIAEVLQNV